MLINLHARVRARCVGALISSYVMALAMGPHAKWKTHSKLGAGTRLNGGECCSRASFDRLVHGGGQGGVKM